MIKINISLVIHLHEDFLELSGLERKIQQIMLNNNKLFIHVTTIFQNNLQIKHILYDMFIFHLPYPYYVVKFKNIYK